MPIPQERQHLSDFDRADTFGIALWDILGKSLGTPVWQLLAGAALVVFDAVPLGDDHPCWQMPNVQITPHLAGITDDSLRAIGQGAGHAVEHLLHGEPPQNCINLRAVRAFWRRFCGTRPGACASRPAHG